MSKRTALKFISEFLAPIMAGDEITLFVKDKTIDNIVVGESLGTVRIDTFVTLFKDVFSESLNTQDIAGVLKAMIEYDDTRNLGYFYFLNTILDGGIPSVYEKPIPTE
jgi:hypothetical protein